MHPNMRNFTAEYVYREFPKWVELANGEKILVHNAEEEAAAVGPETPSQTSTNQNRPAQTGTDQSGLVWTGLDQSEMPAREVLLEEARALGLNPHHRTGDEKLAQMIKEARGE